MRALRSLTLAAFTACSFAGLSCASTRGESAEPLPGPPGPIAPRLTRTHEPRLPEETAASTSGCSVGDLAMCHAAALDAYYAPSSPETDARARVLFEQACQGGYAPSCNGLGVLYEEGRGVAKDPKAAVALYRRACSANGSTGCQHLAAALRTGHGVAKDAGAAARAEARGKCLADSNVTAEGRACPPLDGEP